MNLVAPIGYDVQFELLFVGLRNNPDFRPASLFIKIASGFFFIFSNVHARMRTAGWRLFIIARVVFDARSFCLEAGCDLQ